MCDGGYLCYVACYIRCFRHSIVLANLLYRLLLHREVNFLPCAYIYLSTTVCFFYDPCSMILYAQVLVDLYIVK